jgi:hypothetical protein
MQRSVKPSNKLLVLKTNPRSIKGRGLAIRGFYRFNFPPFSHFCKDQLAGRKPNPGPRWQHLSIV